MTDVFIYKINKDTKRNVDELFSYLVEDEIEKANAFKYQANKDFFIISRFLLKERLGERLGLPAKDVFLKKDKYSRLFLDSKNKKLFDFNITHSDNLFVIVLNDKNRVGVDIEKKKSIDFLGIAKNYFYPKEIEYVLEIQGQEKERFFEIWTLRESYLKAIGKGFYANLFDFYFEMSDDIKLEHKKYKKNDWNFKFLDIVPGFKISLCLENNNFRDLKINYFEI